MDVAQARLSLLITKAGAGAASRLAEHLGVNKATVSRWAQGQGHPRPEHHRGIEKFFDLAEGEFSTMGGDIISRLTAIERDAEDLRSTVQELRGQVEVLVELLRSESGGRP